MRASIIVRSRNEAPRLRLTLASLMGQTEPAEVVIVNDGSTDGTREVIAEAASGLDLRAVHHAEAAGRSSATNAGVAVATGEILIFLDGDTVAAPDLVAQHLDLHRAKPNRVGRGETSHLRAVRDFLDPQTGTPMPGREARVARLPAHELARALVTTEQVQQDMAGLDRRSRPGIYPGFGPGRLLEIEMDALRSAPDCPVLWAAASGHNLSMHRAAFVEAGGFHPRITINEHRELALRICQRGGRMEAVGTRTYHLIHRSGWRDPLQETEWEDIFYAAHPLPEVALLPFLWASLGETSPYPSAALLNSLPALAEAADRYRGLQGLKSVRDAHLRASLSS